MPLLTFWSADTVKLYAQRKFDPLGVGPGVVGMMLAIATVESKSASTQSSESRFMGKVLSSDVAISIGGLRVATYRPRERPIGNRTSTLKISGRGSVWSGQLTSRNSVCPFAERARERSMEAKILIWTDPKTETRRVATLHRQRTREC